MNILVISDGGATGQWLTDRLAPRGIRVSVARPGPDVIRIAREQRPQIAVLDGIESRPQLARMEVAVLKDQSPGIRVIALSATSSERDIEVIEQGVFCYLGGCSLEEVLRAVESATQGRTEGWSSGESNLWGVP